MGSLNMVKKLVHGCSENQPAQLQAVVFQGVLLFGPTMCSFISFKPRPRPFSRALASSRGMGAAAPRPGARGLCGGPPRRLQLHARASASGPKGGRPGSSAVRPGQTCWRNPRNESRWILGPRILENRRRFTRFSEVRAVGRSLTTRSEALSQLRIFSACHAAKSQRKSQRRQEHTNMTRKQTHLWVLVLLVVVSARCSALNPAMAHSSEPLLLFFALNLGYGVVAFLSQCSSCVLSIACLFLVATAVSLFWSRPRHASAVLRGPQAAR